MNLKSTIYLLLAVTILGLFAPVNETLVFVFNTWKAGAMVTVDAAIFMVAVAMLIEQSKRHMMVILITLAHAFYGFLGLIILSFESQVTGFSIASVIGISGYLGVCFIVDGMNGDDGDDPSDIAVKLALGLFTIAAFGLYSSVSIDELFAVLQRYQWMAAQGWNDPVKALNIAASMVVLYGLLNLVLLSLESGKKLSWIEDNEDTAMFIVFSLIMYYIVRAVVQNGLGYVPYLEDPITGIAWELLAVGFILTTVLSFLMKFETPKKILNIVFFVRLG